LPTELLVTLDASPTGIPDGTLRTFAGDLYNFISNVQNELKIKVRNVGRETFAGGRVSRLVYTQGTSGLSISSGYATRDTQEHLVPSLRPGEEKLVVTWGIAPYLEGILAVEFGVQPVSGEVSLKRFEGDAPKNPVTFILSVGRYTDIVNSFYLDAIKKDLDALLELTPRRK